VLAGSGGLDNAALSCIRQVLECFDPLDLGRQVRG
jgi:hypothetical protein